jgi:hypothetical protein
MHLFSFANLFPGSVKAVDRLIDVGNAKYIGTALQNGVTQWLGMRFAAPPLGDLRFRAPVDPPFVEDAQDASTVTSLHCPCSTAAQLTAISSTVQFVWAQAIRSH